MNAAVLIGVISLSAATTAVAPTPVRLLVTAPEMPPSRTVLSFVKGEETFTVEWDPLRDRSLVKPVLLPDRRGWTVSLGSEPVRDASRAGLNYAWGFVGARSLPSLEPSDDACPWSPAGPTGSTSGSTSASSCVVVARAPIPACVKGSADVCDQLDAKDYAITVAPRPFSSGSALAGLKSMDLFGGGGSALGPRALAAEIEPQINELLSIVAEVAVERARSGATRLAETKLRKLVCGDESGKHFEATCVVLENVRLTEIASSGEALANALQLDLAGLAWTTAIKDDNAEERAKRKAALEDLKELLVQLAAGAEQAGGDLDAGRVLDAANELTGKLAAAGEADAATRLRFALLVLGDCYAGGRCSALVVRRYLRASRELVTDGLRWPHDREEEQKEAITTVVLDGWRLLRPDADRTTTEQRIAAARFLLSMGELVLWEHADRFARAREVIEHVIQGDWQTALTRLAYAAKQAHDDEECGDPDVAQQDEERKKCRGLGLNPKVIRVLSSLSSFVTAYGPAMGETVEDRAARREARKEAVNALFDQLTDRSERWGDVVLSLGSNVGVGGGRSLSTATWYGRPSLPLGLALDWFWASDEVHPRWCPSGLHLQASVLDLGQYVQVNTDLTTTSVPNARLDNALMAGLSVGLVWGPPNHLINLSGDLRFTPQPSSLGPVQTTASADFTVGVSLSYYVPFWDFN